MTKDQEISIVKDLMSALAAHILKLERYRED